MKPEAQLLATWEILVNNRYFRYNDGIALGTENNLLPMEQGLKVQRDTPVERNAEDIPADASPLLLMALQQANNLAPTVKGKAKAKAKAAPEADKASSPAANPPAAPSQTKPPSASPKRKSQGKKGGG